MSTSSGAPILIALPSGLVTSGVVAWAVRLVNAFAERGRLAGLILHTPSRGYTSLDVGLHYNVRVHDLADLSPLDGANGDLSPYIHRYRDAVHDLALKAGQPVAFSPNLLGDCYGIAAAVAMVEPEVIRVVGWAHVDLPYEVMALKHYEPCIARFVACSEVLRQRVTAAIPQRAGQVVHVPYGVSVTGEERAEAYQGQRPLRLVYSGRMEQDVKRVGALIHLSDELSRRGVAHQLTLLGDGPAAAEVDAACAGRPSIVRLPAVSSERVHAVLAQHDVFVMASRVEGLSVSLLEAMAVGCVPVVTRTRSGSAEAITDGVDGCIVEWEGLVAGSEHARLGTLLADGVLSVVARGISRFSSAARAAVQRRFTHDSHVARTMEIVDEVTAEAPRTWPASRACAFTVPLGAGASVDAGASSSSATVPADAASRIVSLLSNLKGRRVVVHGTGRHTLELQDALAPFRGLIVGFTDDDPTRHGMTILGLPVVAPLAAASLRATDVVISSFINQDDIWRRRGVYESLGMAVHRLYPAEVVAGAA